MQFFRRIHFVLPQFTLSLRVLGRVDSFCVTRGASVVVGKTHIGGLGGVSMRVPHGGLMIVAKLSNSKGSSLTFSALCTRKRHHCIRDLDDCTHRFLKHVDGPRYSFVGKVPPTVTVRRGMDDHGPQSAINASARVCRCLQLLCTHINGAFDPIDKRRIGGRSTRSVIGYVLRCPRKAECAILTPVLLHRSHALRRRLRVSVGRNFAHLRIGNRVVHVSRCGPGTKSAIFLLVSHVATSSRGSSIDHLASSTRATVCRKSNTYLLHFCRPSKDAYLCHFDAGFRTSNVAFRRPGSRVFSFGSPVNTYPTYRKFKGIVNVSRRLIVPSHSLSICSNTMMY